MTGYLATIRKALMATGFTLVSGVGLALGDGHLEGVEVGQALGLALVAGAATYLVPNAKHR